MGQKTHFSLRACAFLRKMEASAAFEHACGTLSRHLREALTNRELDLESIVPVTINLMTFTEGLGSLSGPEKKRAVISTIQTFVEENVENPLRKDLLAFTSLTLPGLIDKLVDVSTGKIKIKVQTPLCLQRLIGQLSCCSVQTS